MNRKDANIGPNRRTVLLTGTGALAIGALGLVACKGAASSRSNGDDGTADVAADDRARQRSVPAAAPSSGEAALGINLSPINYWTTVAFIDRLKASSGWNTYGKPAPVDALGYPAGLGGQPLIAAMVPCEPGTYLLSHDGDMDARIQGGSLVSRSRNGSVFEVRSDAPQGRALIVDAIRKPPTFMRLINRKHAAAFAAGEIFAPEFLELITGFDTLRFMDWMQINNSKVTDNIPPVESCSYADGVPIEIMMALARRVGAHPWLCVPHLASDALMSRMIETVRKAGDGGKAPYLEYSNEVWNWGFDQARHAQREAKARWGEATPGDVYYGYRAGQVARLARGSGCRVVLGCQTVSPHRAEAVWDGVRRAGATDADFAAWIIAAYVNGTLTDAQGPTLALAAKNDVDGAIDNLLHANGSGAMSVDTMAAVYAQQGTIARAHGLKLLAYESNLHLNVAPAFTAQQALVTPFFMAIVRSPASAKVTAANLAAFAAAGGSLACLYNLSSGVFDLLGSGSWDLIKKRAASGITTSM